MKQLAILPVILAFALASPLVQAAGGGSAPGAVRTAPTTPKAAAVEGAPAWRKQARPAFRDHGFEKGFAGWRQVGGTDLPKTARTCGDAATARAGRCRLQVGTVLGRGGLESGYLRIAWRYKHLAFLLRSDRPVRVAFAAGNTIYGRSQVVRGGTKTARWVSVRLPNRRFALRVRIFGARDATVLAVDSFHASRLPVTAAAATKRLRAKR